MNKATAVAAADDRPEALENAQRHLDLDSRHCFSSAAEAFDSRRADFALILAPSPHHEKLIELALKYDLHVLVDAPLADTMPAACRIYRMIRDSNKKLAIILPHRFDQDKQSLLRRVQSREYGRLNYLVSRSLHNRQKRGTWGRLRHDMINPILVEDAVHQFDLFRAVAGSEPKSVMAVSWGPSWGDFRGDCAAFAVVEMQNGVHCQYEGSAVNACSLNPWGQEYLRAECELGTLELDRRKLRLLKGEFGEEPRPADLPLAEQPSWGELWLTEQFCDYVNDLCKPAHRLKEAFGTMALTFAAVESARTARWVDVAQYLKNQFAAA